MPDRIAYLILKAVGQQSEQLLRSRRLPAARRALLHFVPLFAPRALQVQSTLSLDRGQKPYVPDTAIA
jgi:hypothetical protein